MSNQANQENRFSFDDLLEQNPEQNPFTKREIKVNSQTYKKLRLVAQLHPKSFDEAKTLYQMKIGEMRRKLLGPAKRKPKKCEHGKRKTRCRECDYPGYCYDAIMREVRFALIKNKELPDSECLKYLGCKIDTLKKHIEDQFNDGISWTNRGQCGGWEIDHIEPFKYGNPTAEEKLKRLHYKNLQPLPKAENLRKSNKFISCVKLGKGKVIANGVEIEGEDITVNFSQEQAE